MECLYEGRSIPMEGGVSLWREEYPYGGRSMEENNQIIKFRTNQRNFFVLITLVLLQKR